MTFYENKYHLYNSDTRKIGVWISGMIFFSLFPIKIHLI
jgi:hypothetical protein